MGHGDPLPFKIPDMSSSICLMLKPVHQRRWFFDLQLGKLVGRPHSLRQRTI
jgi:hypothetical protein